MMFHTDTPGSTSANGESYRPSDVINRYVGTKPPLKNMVIVYTIMINFFPTKSSRESGYAAMTVKGMAMMRARMISKRSYSDNCAKNCRIETPTCNLRYSPLSE